MPKITSKTVKTAQPSSSAYFIRDNDLNVTACLLLTHHHM